MVEVNINADLDDPRALITKVVQKHQEVPQLQFINEDPEGVVIQLVTGGFTNYSYLVKSRCGKHSVFLKHGVSHVKVDPEQPMPLERRQVEYDMLVLIHSLAPGGCPAPYCLDMEHNVVIMEDMTGMAIFQSFTSAGHVNLLNVRQWSQILAKLHNATMKSTLTAGQWQDLDTKFNHPMVSGTILNFYLLKGLDPSDHTIELIDEMVPAMDAFFSDKLLVEKAKSFRQKADVAECVIHGDCHQLSVFSNKEKTVVYDLEFSCLSQRSLNVAVPQTGYFMSLFALEKHPDIQDIRIRFKGAVKEFLTVYLDEMPDLQDHQTQAVFLSDVAAYLAIATMRMANFFGMGTAFSISPKQRARLITFCTRALRDNERLTTVDSFVDYFFSKE